MKTKKHTIRGASLERIEELDHHGTPDWVPYTVPVPGTEISALDEAMVNTLHFSGLLRQLSQFEYVDAGMVEGEDGGMYCLEEILDDAAERLDQAHEEWLEAQAKASKFVVETLVGVRSLVVHDDDWENLVREDGTVLVECVEYDTLAEAQDELADHFENLENADMVFHRADYRIRQVFNKAPASGGQTEQDMDFICEAARDFMELMEADVEDELHPDPDTIKDIDKIGAALKRLGR